jgi:hypothetical protein
MRAKQKIITNSQKKTYIIPLKKNHNYWLLLILLPIILAILLLNIHKTLILKTIDKQTNKPIPNVTITFSYTNNILINPHKKIFFDADTTTLVASSDRYGIAKFKIKYSIFSKIFFPKQKTKIIASANCIVPDTLSPILLKLTKHDTNIIPLNIQKTQIILKIIDKSDSQELPNVKVSINDGYEKQNFVSNAAGYIYANISKCADTVKISASKAGYKPLTISLKAFKLYQPNQTLLALEPLTTPISFFVRDLYTHQAIVDAKVSIIFQNSNYQVSTNTNGIGKAFFDTIATSKKIYIKASHPAYFDTTTTPSVASKFSNFSKDKKTIYLRPKPGNITFLNTDALTKKPLPNVINQVFVNGKNIGQFISNSQGQFSVPNLNKNDRISIQSQTPAYIPNFSSVYNKKVEYLNSIQKKTIPLEPDLKPRNVQPPKENCRAHFSGTLLSDIFIDGHISTIFKPDKYGEYVGAGDYPSNKIAFPNAVAHTFDAIAIDKNTRVIIYSKPNFKGNILLDITGPALINNVKWKHDSRIASVNKKTFSPKLQAIFPQNVRKWSSQDMNKWSNGSVKIICINKKQNP